MRMQAFGTPWDGLVNPESNRVLMSCFRRVPGIIDQDALISVALTYDHGYHSSGWWKNSQFDECLHLSISVVGHRKGTGFKSLKAPEAATEAEVKAWLDLVFAPLHPKALIWLWEESGKTTTAIRHFRLFFSKLTREPILPEGEVYDLVPYADGSSPEKIFNRMGMGAVGVHQTK